MPNAYLLLKYCVTGNFEKYCERWSIGVLWKWVRTALQL